MIIIAFLLYLRKTSLLSVKMLPQPSDVVHVYTPDCVMSVYSFPAIGPPLSVHVVCLGGVVWHLIRATTSGGGRHMFAPIVRVSASGTIPVFVVNMLFTVKKNFHVNMSHNA